MRSPLLLLLLNGLCFALSAQVDSLMQPTEPDQQVIEDFLQNTESEGTFDFNTIFEELEFYRENPINLNTITEGQLQDLNLLSDIQILELLKYRRNVGAFISIYELQAVPSLDLLTIRRLLPFVQVGGDLDDYQTPIGQMLREGRNELYLRWFRILEDQRGYTPLGQDETGSRYAGDPNQFYMRYKHAYSNRLSYGFTAEKDRGEEFFKGSNPYGFDFYSAHLFLKDYSKRIKAIAIGDYAVSFGQGLILYSGFGYGKSSLVMNIKRTSRTLRPYTSVNESNFQRGAAATLAFGDHIEVTALGSYRRRSANLLEADTTDLEDEIRQASSLDLDGLHRTANEISDEGAIGQTTIGGQVKWSNRYGHIALNTLYEELDADLTQFRATPNNRFDFTGNSLHNISLDYSFILQNFNFFGETARAANGAIATVNGLLMGLDRKVDLALLVRHYPRNYQALNANAFGETFGAQNETGVYLGMEVRPHKNWRLSAYFDTWRHPWLRFTVDAPSTGYEYRGRLTYYLKRDLEVYLEIREEHKAQNINKIEGKNDFTLDRHIFQARLHIAKKVTKELELRSRIDVGYTDNEINNRQEGFAIYQDVLYRPTSFPFSFTTRYALFDTDGFQSRFYSFENNLLYTFAIPAYYNRGSRFYFNLRYRGIRNLTIEGRIAQTFWKNQDTFGSGNEQIDGQTRTSMGAQIKYKF
ncbi:MAG: helix-hairpin-helix domain-containing protein [Phaeodactylibacter sp.]|uniref:ComEA family DNA-binding protein n=1 Tax=Phaeodactylibacter sp. TaxID=1940289 RepID=UPI0032EE4043